MTDSPRDLQAEALYRWLYRIWPEGQTFNRSWAREQAPALNNPLSILLGRRRVEYMPDRRIYRARMNG